MIQKQKGNSGYLNKWQLKKKNQPREHSVRRKVTWTKILPMLGLEGGKDPSAGMAGKETNVGRNCIWGFDMLYVYLLSLCVLH